MSQTTAEKTRTRASLSGELADFLIELSAAFQKHGMYPAGHPALEPAANAVFSRLSRLLLEHGSLSIGVAREQLVIEGVATDSSHPLLRSLAARLHGHALGAISFAEGVTPGEIAEVLRLVSADPERTGRPLGREDEAVLKGRPHVRLHPVHFDKLRIREGAAGGGGRRPVDAHLWIGLAQAAMAARDLEAAGDEAYHPDRVAAAIDDRSGEEGYDQVVIGYMVQIARELRDADPVEAEDLRARFSQLISKLRPETLKRLLRMGGDLRQRKDFLLDASRGVEVDAVLELVRAAAGDDGGSDISRWMMRLLSKMARHAEREGTPATWRADEALRDQVRVLLSDWRLENPNPGEYEQTLARMSVSTPVTRMTTLIANAEEPERIVQMSLEADVAGEPLARAVDALVAREDGTGRLIAALDGAPGNGDGPGEAAAAVWERLSEPAVVRRLVEAEDPDFEALDRVLPRAGLEAADALLDRLATAGDLSLRRKTFDRLLALGPRVGRLAADRVERPDEIAWYVLRNMLALLAAMDGLPEGFDPRPFRAHPNPQVRVEALKLCLRTAEDRDAALLAALADESDRALALGLAAAERGAPAAAEARLREIATDEARATELRLPAIRALARLETTVARATLLELAAPRRRLLRTELPEATPELAAAVRELAALWPSDPKVAEILGLARASDDAELRSAAEGRGLAPGPGPGGAA